MSIVDLSSGSMVMPLASAQSAAMVGISFSQSRAGRRSSPKHVLKVRCGHSVFKTDGVPE